MVNILIAIRFPHSHHQAFAADVGRSEHEPPPLKRAR